MTKPIDGKVYGYVRVSTIEQADNGLSLDTQRRQIEGYAKIQGWKVDKVYVERAVSGAKPLVERKEGAALLAALKTGDKVIVPKLDRMFRSALDALKVLEELRDRNVSMHFIDLGGDVTGDGISKLVFTILSAVAEAERDRIRERIRDVKRDQREQGRYLGGTVPFGWRKVGNGKLVEKPDEQKAIRRMETLRKKGRSFRAIAADIRAGGFKVTHAGVRNILHAVTAGSK
jgi:putative DNA-invertase from lambdoid prophage Rac